MKITTYLILTGFYFYKDAIEFWLKEKKVDGLRIDALGFLFEDKNFEDEPVKIKGPNTEVIFFIFIGFLISFR